MISQSLIIYLKTTETCQLNCQHCFTNGKNGKNIYFKPEKVSKWFHNMEKFNDKFNGIQVAFHGGEPMLAPVSDMRAVYESCKDLWGGKIDWTVTTNLVYPLTQEKIDFFVDVCDKNISTSWDIGIRFETEAQESLWEKNVRTLMAIDGFDITCQLSVSKSMIAVEPEEILKKMVDLKIPYVHLERISPDGNAKLNDVIPTNVEQRLWMKRFWDVYTEKEYYKKTKVMFFDSILTSIVYSTHAGCRCRECEQKIFTLNADGRIGGCPNGAVESTFGDIEMEIKDLLMAPGRLQNIACETIRHEECLSCPVAQTCNGDCHQLKWDESGCPAPKELMIELNEKMDMDLYKSVLGDFMGTE